MFDSKYTRMFCIALCFLAPLTAEEDIDLTSFSLEQLLDMPINVASQFEETELEASATVEIITRDQWRVYGAEGIEEAVSRQPSVMSYPTAWGGSAIAIRGYATSLSVRGIATVVDGIPQNSLRNGTALYDLRQNVLASFDQIEMIRGTASALYGADAFHGVISLKSYTREENNIQANLSFSSENHRQAQFAFTRRLGNGLKLDVSMAGVDQGDQSIDFNYTWPFTQQVESAARENQFDAYTFVVKLDAQHNDRWESNYAFYLRNHNSYESPSAGRSLSGNSILGERDLTDGETGNQMFRFGFSWQGPNHLSLESKMYGWQADTKNWTDLTTIPGIGITTFGDQEETFYGGDVFLKQTENKWNTQWALGVSFKTNEITKDGSFALDADRNQLAQLPPLWEDLDRDVQSLVFEGRTQFKEGELQLIFGGRYDDYSDFGGQTSPRLGLIWLPNQQSSVKFIFGEAFRAPIAAEIAGTTTFLSNPNLNPETTTSMELAYTYKTDSWKLVLTAFQSDWEDGIVLVPIDNPDFTSQYRNIGENESQGFEFTFEGGRNQWRWNVNGSLVESEALTQQGAIEYGAFPGQILNVQAGYFFEKHKLQFDVLNRVLSDMDEGPAIRLIPDPEPLDDFFSTDLSLTWQPKKNLELQAMVKNIFDQENTVPSVWNAENGQPMLGTQARLRLRYQF